MPFSLENVVPWGRRYHEYVKMFALNEADVTQKILGCGDGPASFNAEGTAQGMQIISCDPLYQFSKAALARRIEEVTPMVLAETEKNVHQFVWNFFPNLDALAETRQSAMQRFLADYEEGKKSGRYITAELPTLPFEDGQFELALCSHFLFLYSEQFSREFHVQSVLELCRVAGEVRIFPLLNLAAKPSEHLASVIEVVRSQGYTAQQITVPYEFQREGNQMLAITR